MKIRLDANPSNAPGCILIVAEDGQDRLVQLDWDWPGVASVFGFMLSECKPPAPDDYSLWQEGKGEFTPEEEQAFEQWEKRWCPAEGEAQFCEHSGTDGTIKCPDCGMEPGRFIELAREWMDANDGAEAEDPGYFDQS